MYFLRTIIIVICLLVSHCEFQSLGLHQNQVDFHVTDVLTDQSRIMCQITIVVGDCAPGRAPIFNVGDNPTESFIAVEWGDASVSGLTIKDAAKLSFVDGQRIHPLSTDKLQGLQMVSHIYNLTQWRMHKAGSGAGTATSPVITCTRFGDTAIIKYDDAVFSIEEMCRNSKFDWDTVNAQIPIISTDVAHKPAFYISPSIACVPFNKNVAQWDGIEVVYTNAASIPTNGFYNLDQNDNGFTGGSTGTTCFTNVLRSETSADIRITMTRAGVPMTVITSRLNFNHTGNARAHMKYKNGRLAGRGSNYRPPVVGAFVRNFGRMSQIDGTSPNTASVLLFLPQQATTQPNQGVKNITGQVVINWSHSSSTGISRGHSIHDIQFDGSFIGALPEFQIVFLQGTPSTPNSLTVNVATNFLIEDRASNTSGYFGHRLSLPAVSVPLSKPYYTQEYVYEGWVDVVPSLANPSVFPIDRCQSAPTEASYRTLTAAAGNGTATVWETIPSTSIATLGRQTLILNCKRMETGLCNIQSNEYRVLCVV
jgi:hypothetical protein